MEVDLGGKKLPSQEHKAYYLCESPGRLIHILHRTNTVLKQRVSEEHPRVLAHAFRMSGKLPDSRNNRPRKNRPKIRGKTRPLSQSATLNCCTATPCWHMEAGLATGQLALFFLKRSYQQN